MKAVRIRKQVETEEEVLTGAKVISRNGTNALVQLKTDVQEIKETEEKQKHYRFTLIEFETKDTGSLEERINGKLQSWVEEAKKVEDSEAKDKTQEETLKEVKETTDELVELMADVLGGAL